MSLQNCLPLIVFVVVATVTPGSATTLAVASGANFGYRRSLPYMMGIAVGLGSMAAAAATGLGGIMQANPDLQSALKLIGSLYLVWLATRIARSASPHAASAPRNPIGFAGGVWMLWHNPKGWAMTLAAAASFAVIVHGPGRLAALLGISFAVAAMTSLSIWCMAGLALARLLRSERQWRCLNGVLAALLVASIVAMWLP
ncbi:MAG: LysE family translocator [Burkholderiales bacterium]|nr:LysE family translocator [Burkholderiales bacterium]MDE2287895.1 LysE family translocator [Burkholderiales bacterium]MDE2609772.1 LysE family translocator [Burkholderiales bacterium]